jgi:hypothetical protein
VANGDSEVIIDDDTLWLASCLAHESVRPDRLLTDPYASHLAGSRGARAFVEWGPADRTTRAALTVAVVDDLLQKTILEHRVHTVIHLGAGLDTRPFRLRLPRDLRWVELDRDAVFLYKGFRLAHIPPTCRVERVGLDIDDAEQRAAALRRVSRGVTRGLLLTGNPLERLEPDTIKQLGAGLPRGIKSWILGTPESMTGRDDLIAELVLMGWEAIDERPLVDEGRRLLSARPEWLASGPADRYRGAVWVLRRAGSLPAPEGESEVT